MQIDKIKLTQIKKAEYNPRTISEENYAKLKNSVKNFGLVEPILINLKNNTIISGHQRYDVLTDLILTDGNLAEKEFHLLKYGDLGLILDTDEPTLENEDYEKALNITLNNTNLTGDYDFEKLGELLDELSLAEIDVSLTGFEEFEFSNMDNFFDDNFDDSDTEVVEYDGNFDMDFQEDETYTQDATFELNERDVFTFGDFDLTINKNFVDSKIKLTLYQDTFRVSFDNFSDEDLLKEFIQNNKNAKDRLRSNGKLKSDIYG